MSMRPAIRPLALVAIAVCGSACVAGCGGSGAGLIPSASAGPLEQDFVEVWQRARSGNGSCTATSEALEKTEADFVKISATIDSKLRSRLQEGITHLHSQALEECSRPKTTATTTVTTKTHSTETFLETTATSVTTSQPATTSSVPSGEEETPHGGTPAPGGGENASPGGAEAQGGQPNENGLGGADNGAGR